MEYFSARLLFLRICKFKIQVYFSTDLYQPSDGFTTLSTGQW